MITTVATLPGLGRYPGYNPWGLRKIPLSTLLGIGLSELGKKSNFKPLIKLFKVIPTFPSHFTTLQPRTYTLNITFLHVQTTNCKKVVV